MPASLWEKGLNLFSEIPSGDVDYFAGHASVHHEGLPGDEARLGAG